MPSGIAPPPGMTPAEVWLRARAGGRGGGRGGGGGAGAGRREAAAPVLVPCRGRRGYGAVVTTERSYARIAGLSVIGVLIVVIAGAWLLATPSDDYVLLPD